jgi:hypothetical protein
MKTKIYVVSETMDESQIVSGVLLKAIHDQKLDAEIVSVTTNQFINEQSVVCVPYGGYAEAASGHASAPVVAAQATVITVINDPISRPIHVGTGETVTISL